MGETSALTESTYYILLSLWTPQHGYGIMQQTEQLSGERVRLAAGTLYGALNALCEKGWIAPLPVAHGSSNARAIRSAIMQAIRYVEGDVVKTIEENIEQMTISY